MTTELTRTTRTTPTRSTINIPVPPELKAHFYGYCQSQGLAPVKVIRLYIKSITETGTHHTATPKRTDYKRVQDNQAKQDHNK